MLSELVSQPGVIGIGTDLLDQARIEKAVARHGERFARRILTDTEYALWQSRQGNINFLAKQFAAKEALSKALGCGIAQGVGFHQLEVLRDTLGAPVVNLSGVAQQRLLQLQGQRAFVSLSDEGQWVQAFAVLAG